MLSHVCNKIRWLLGSYIKNEYEKNSNPQMTSWTDLWLKKKIVCNIFLETNKLWAFTLYYKYEKVHVMYKMKLNIILQSVRIWCGISGKIYDTIKNHRLICRYLHI